MKQQKHRDNDQSIRNGSCKAINSLGHHDMCHLIMDSFLFAEVVSHSVFLHLTQHCTIKENLKKDKSTRKDTDVTENVKIKKLKQWATVVGQRKPCIGVACQTCQHIKCLWYSKSCNWTSRNGKTTRRQPLKVWASHWLNITGNWKEYCSTLGSLKWGGGG